MIKKSVTIKDVAHEARVSTGSVSRVINGFDVNPEIRERVKSAIQKMNYYPSVSTQVTKTRSGAIVILLSRRQSETNLWTQQVVMNLAVVLGNYGYRTILRFHDEAINDVPEEMMTADGCIVWGKFSDEFFRNLIIGNCKIAIVGYSRKLPVKNSVSVLVDHKGSMCRVVEYLMAHNHRDIGMVAHQEKSGHHFERYQGFLESMAKFNCPVRKEWIDNLTEKKQGDTGLRSGYDATCRILQQKTRPTAIIYGSDLFAYGGMEAIKKNGLRVPEDVSVIGFDDMVLSREMFPALTTMRMDTGELSRILVESMERLLLERSDEPEIVLSRTLVERESVAVRA